MASQGTQRNLSLFTWPTCKLAEADTQSSKRNREILAALGWRERAPGKLAGRMRSHTQIRPPKTPRLLPDQTVELLAHLHARQTTNVPAESESERGGGAKEEESLCASWPTHSRGLGGTKWPASLRINYSIWWSPIGAASSFTDSQFKSVVV